MTDLFRILSLRYLLRHPARSWLVVLSIALGVATWIGTHSLHAVLQRSVQQAATPLRGLADVYVTSRAGHLDAALGEKLRDRVPAVARVEPVLIEDVTAAGEPTPPGAPDKDRPAGQGAILIGLLLPMNPEEAQRDLGDRDIELSDFEPGAAAAALLLGKEKPVLVGEKLDEFLKGRRSFVLRVGDHEHPVLRVGIVRARGAASGLGGQVVITRWDLAAELAGRKGKVQRLDVTFDQYADREDALARLRAALPESVQASTPAENDQRVGELLRGMEVGFKLCGGFALVVGLFLVYNALSVSVAERRHDIGILRAVGATRWQVRLFFLAEAFVQGVAGAALGVPLGLGMAKVALGPILGLLKGVYLPLHAHEVVVTPGMVLWAVAAGLATALVAALVPASRAAAEEPAEAVRQAPVQASAAYRLLQIGASLTLILAGVALTAFRDQLTSETLLPVGVVLLASGAALCVLGFRLQGGEAETDPTEALRAARNRLATILAGALLAGLGTLAALLRDSVAEGSSTYFAPALMFLGTIVLTPLLSAFVIRVMVLPVARRALPVVSRLAAENLVRSPGRTGLVIAVLAVGIALSVQTAGLIRSNEEPLLAWIDDTVGYDLHVTSGGIISASGQPNTLDESILGELRKALPKGSRLVGKVYQYPDWAAPRKTAGRVASDAKGPAQTRVFLEMIDAEEHYRANRERNPDHPRLELWRRLAREPGTAFVSENFARMYDVSAGDDIEHNGLRLHVLDVVPDYSWIRGALFVDRQSMRDREGGNQLSAVEVYLPEGADVDQVRQELQQSSLAARRKLFTATRLEYRENAARIVRNLYALAYTQEVVIGLVSVLGVVLALLISILSRRRELGLLRAVGCTRAQVVQTVLAEAFLIGLVGTVLGILIGLPLEWYVVKVIVFEEAGFVFPVLIPWVETAAIAALALTSATLAGLLPALRAMRDNVADAIAYE